MTSKKTFPTESELEILQVLWQLGPSSVRTVNELLNEKREVGYTTSLKIMQIMNGKGLVTRDTTARTHIYHPAVQEKNIQRNLLDNFIDKAYRGSAMSLVMQALGNEKATTEELDELKAMIRNIEDQEAK